MKSIQNRILAIVGLGLFAVCAFAIQVAQTTASNKCIFFMMRIFISMTRKNNQMNHIKTEGAKLLR